MQNYKPPLRISARPEPLVVCYLACLSLICLGFLFYAAFYKWYALALIIPWFYISRNYWQRYYTLAHSKSVIALRIDAKDRLFFTLVDQTETQVKLINKLHLEQLLVLYAIPELNQSELDRLEHQFSWQAIKRKVKNIIYENMLTKRLVFIVSEQSLASKNYRELLRRINQLF